MGAAIITGAFILVFGIVAAVGLTIGHVLNKDARGGAPEAEEPPSGTHPALLHLVQPSGFAQFGGGRSLL